MPTYGLRLLSLVVAFPLTHQPLHTLYEAADCWAVAVEFVVLHEFVVEVGVEFLRHPERGFYERVVLFLRQTS